MAHLKRFNLPASLVIKKKGITFLARPSPGSHKQNQAVTINILLKDLLHYTATTRETRKVIQAGNILVDGVARKDYHFPLGIMDTITIPPLKEHYILLYTEKGRLALQPWLTPQEKLCKITGKHTLPKKKTQINLYDGKNIIADNKDYKVGDTVIVSNGKIKKHLKFEKGALIYLIGGKHIGKTGTLTDIKTFPGMEKDRIIIQVGQEHIETLKDYAFVIEKPFN